MPDTKFARTDPDDPGVHLARALATICKQKTTVGVITVGDAEEYDFLGEIIQAHRDFFEGIDDRSGAWSLIPYAAVKQIDVDPGTASPRSDIERWAHTFLKEVDRRGHIEVGPNHAYITALRGVLR